MSDEIWLPVVGYEGLYEVSDRGRVRSLDRLSYTKGRVSVSVRKGRILKASITSSGHAVVGLSRNARAAQKQVHRLVLEAFVGPCPPDMECCHGPGGPADNRIENLRWDSRSANALDRVSDGRDHNSNKTHCKWGHELSYDNVYWQGSSRLCRKCRARRDKELKARRRELGE